MIAALRRSDCGDLLRLEALGGLILERKAPGHYALTINDEDGRHEFELRAIGNVLVVKDSTRIKPKVNGR